MMKAHVVDCFTDGLRLFDRGNEIGVRAYQDSRIVLVAKRAGQEVGCNHHIDTLFVIRVIYLQEETTMYCNFLSGQAAKKGNLLSKQFIAFRITHFRSDDTNVIFTFKQFVFPDEVLQQGREIKREEIFAVQLFESMVEVAAVYEDDGSFGSIAHATIIAKNNPVIKESRGELV